MGNTPKGLTICNRCFCRLVGQADELFKLVAHFTFKNLNLFEDDAVLDHRVDEVARVASARFTTLSAKRLCWWCALVEGVTHYPSSCYQNERLKIGQQ